MTGKPRAPKPLATTDQRTPEETERVREATLKRLLETPPKRHDEMIAERKIKRGKDKTQ